MDELLDEARKACKATTDAELAKCLRISQQALSLYRTGEGFPGWATCERMAKVTGLELSDVLGRVAAARTLARHRQPSVRTA